MLGQLDSEVKYLKCQGTEVAWETDKPLNNSGTIRGSVGPEDTFSLGKAVYIITEGDLPSGLSEHATG